jgi:WD40 repeat protein
MQMLVLFYFILLISETLQLWDTGSLASIATFQGTDTALDRFFCLAVSHDGNYVVGGTLSCLILVFQTSPPRQKALFSLEGHSNHVTSLRFGPIGTPFSSSLFSCAKDHSLRRWNLSTQSTEMIYSGNLAGKRGHTNEVHDFALSFDGLYICSVGHKGIPIIAQTKLWDVRSGDCIYNYQGHTADVFAAVASRASRGRWRFYTAGSDNMIKVWLGNPGSSSDKVKQDKTHRMKMFAETVSVALALL